MKDFAKYQLIHTEDRIDGSTDLVAHVCKEGGLGLIGFLGFDRLGTHNAYPAYLPGYSKDQEDQKTACNECAVICM